jgi:hypothetical protein
LTVTRGLPREEDAEFPRRSIPGVEQISFNQTAEFLARRMRQSCFGADMT